MVCGKGVKDGTVVDLLAGLDQGHPRHQTQSAAGHAGHLVSTLSLLVFVLFSRARPLCHLHKPESADTPRRKHTKLRQPALRILRACIFEWERMRAARSRQAEATAQSSHLHTSVQMLATLPRSSFMPAAYSFIRRHVSAQSHRRRRSLHRLLAS